jgi:hypothetical protein
MDFEYTDEVDKLHRSVRGCTGNQMPPTNRH